MTFQRITLPSIDAIRSADRGRRGNGRAQSMDRFLVCDMAGFAEAANTSRNSSYGGGGAGDWYGGMSFDQSLTAVRQGDTSSVAASEAMLSRLEDMVFVSTGYVVRNDVVGFLPDIPSFIAGTPMAMLNRDQVVQDTAPLSVIVDLTSSGGISASDVRQRGMAILALVRLLANIRPVELHVMIGLGDHSGTYGAFVAVKIDTTPLDLSRGAHMLTHPSVSRALGYGVAHHHLGAGGHWPYNDVELQRKHGAQIMSRVLHPASDVLWMPPVYATDKSIKDPVTWVREMLAQYGGQTLDAA
jgi:hypothetical protein